MLNLLPLGKNANEAFLRGHARGHSHLKDGLDMDQRTNGFVLNGNPFWHGYKAGYANTTPDMDEQTVQQIAARDLTDYRVLAIRMDDYVKFGPNFKRRKWD